MAVARGLMRNTLPPLRYNELLCSDDSGNHVFHFDILSVISIGLFDL